MKILHVITDIDLGGAEKQLLNVSREQVRHNHRVEIWYLKGDGMLAADFGAIGVPTMATGRFLNLFSLILRMRRLQMFDVVHAHLPRAELFVAFLSIFKKNHIVVTKHNSEKFFPKGPRKISRLLSLFVESRAQAIICISKTVYKYLDNLGEVSNKSKYSVVYYGIEENETSKSPYRSTRKYSVSTGENMDGTINVICIARLTAQKNLNFLVRVFRHLPEKYQLRIFGEGDLEDSLRAQINELNLGERVHLCGKTKSIDSELQLSDLLVLPSLYEGFGLVLLEAIQNNVPIVASNIDVIKEVLGENYPFLASPSEENSFAIQIMRLQYWDNEDRFKLYHSLKKRFHIKNCYENIHRVYKEVTK